MTVLEQAASSLERLAVAVRAAYNSPQTFSDTWGWQYPPISPGDVAEIIERKAAFLRRFDPETLIDDVTMKLGEVTRRSNFMISQTVPNIQGGNSTTVVLSLFQLCLWIDSFMPDLPPARVSVDWQEVASKNLLPPALLRRLRAVEGRLTELEPRTAHLATQIEVIASAHDAAENLPATQADLKEAVAAAKKSFKDINSIYFEIINKYNSAVDKINEMNDLNSQSKKIMESLGLTSSAVTKKGLAQAFSKKAMWLNASVGAWVVGLVVALFAGANVSAKRFDHLEALLMSSSAQGQQVWIELVLALLGVGAPIWFAWVATKQIGQRFRLAEDYGFKASVATAYEGYRLEAVRLDEAFASRLFASALTRLEEEPLRLVDATDHGSPFHELCNSPAFREALNKFPDLQLTVDKLLDKGGTIVSSALGKGRGAASKVADAVTPEKE